MWKSPELGDSSTTKESKMKIVNEHTTVSFAVEALQSECLKGTITLEEARKYLADFGGGQYIRPHDGAELWIFVYQPWDVQILVDESAPERCILWRTKSPD